MPLPHVVNVLYTRLALPGTCLFWELSAHVTKNRLRDNGNAERDMLICLVTYNRFIAPVEPESGAEPVPQTPISPKKKDIDKGTFSCVLTCDWLVLIDVFRFEYW